MMSSWNPSNRELGARGEQTATRYLLAKGLIIMDKNWHCPRGELDIVASDSDTLIFVEVKTRRIAKDAMDRVLESITSRKRERILATIYHYLADKELEDCNWRLDIVAVLWRHEQEPIVKHLVNILDWE